jgi:Tfp pilus assembly protein PilF
MSADKDSSHLGKRLDTWKEIGAFFGRDARTAKRWEETRGLPVHRVPGGGRANVYAYPQELADWLKGNNEAVAVPDEAPPAATWPRPLLALALLVTFAAVFLIVQSRRSGHPSSLAASASRRVDPQAQQLYLKGIYYWNKRSPESLNQAVDYFTQAIVKDPNYAEAYVGLANCYNLMREYTSMPPGEAYAKAKAAAEHAIALDDSLSSAHSSLAFVDFYWSWDVSGAEREFKRALELDPNSVPAHHWYATFLLSLGRFQESLEEIDKAQQLDPHSSSILADKGLILYHSGQTDQGLALLKQLEAAEPAFLSPHTYLADIYFNSGDCRGFLSELKTAGTLLNDQQRLAIVKVGEKGFAASGAKGMLTAILALQKRYYAQRQMPAYELARTCAVLGEKQEAIHFLQIAYASHEPSVFATGVDFAFRSLHSDDSFRKILAQIGLPTGPPPAS